MDNLFRNPGRTVKQGSLTELEKRWYKDAFAIAKQNNIPNHISIPSYIKLAKFPTGIQEVHISVAHESEQGVFNWNNTSDSSDESDELSESPLPRSPSPRSPSPRFPSPRSPSPPPALDFDSQFPEIQLSMNRGCVLYDSTLSFSENMKKCWDLVFKCESKHMSFQQKSVGEYAGCPLLSVYESSTVTEKGAYLIRDYMEGALTNLNSVKYMDGSLFVGGQHGESLLTTIDKLEESFGGCHFVYSMLI